MTRLRHLVLAASAIVLAACATSTPYQPATKPGAYDGYSQTMLENNRARVTFAGNSLTDRETVENYLLFRSAELAKERGYDYFTLVERDTEKKTRVTATPKYGAGFYDPYFHYSYYRPNYGWGPYAPYSRWHAPYYRDRGWGFMGYPRDRFYHEYDVRESTKYRAVAEVIFGKGPKPNNDHAFSAQEIITNLGPTIIYPETKES